MNIKINYNISSLGQYNICNYEDLYRVLSNRARCQ